MYSLNWRGEKATIHRGIHVHDKKIFTAFWCFGIVIIYLSICYKDWFWIWIINFPWLYDQAHVCDSFDDVTAKSYSLFLCDFFRIFVKRSTFRIVVLCEIHMRANSCHYHWSAHLKTAKFNGIICIKLGPLNNLFRNKPNYRLCLFVLLFFFSVLFRIETHAISNGNL